MAIVKAKLDDLDQCVDLLFIPEMGQLYFPRRELLRSEIEKSINIDEIFVERSSQNSKIQGVIWYQHDSLFHSFPYLHMIAVRCDCRNQGVGARLMDFLSRILCVPERTESVPRCFYL